MAIEADILVDRRRLKRRLALWRLAAVLLALGAVGALLFASDEGVSGLFGRTHIARVSVTGLIQDNRRQIELLDRIGKSSRVQAVILNINSPGGTTAGGEALHEAVGRLGEAKPVVAVMSTIATSAAYLAALPAHRIFARGNTITGSVGVVFQWAEVSELLKTLGVKVEEIKSGPLKANPSPFVPIDDAGRQVAQQMVDGARQWFIELVASGRQIDPGTIPGLTEGRVYSGRMALDLKLIDAIGGEEAAKAWLEAERGIDKGLDIVDWKEKDGGALGLLGSLTLALGRMLGVDAGAVIALLESPRIGGARLDGLVSLWHPSLD